MIEAVAAAIAIPTFLMIVIVAPIWIGMHYSTKNRRLATLGEEQAAELERLTSAAERMGERIETLEAILDAETPGWRSRAGRSD